ncbi:MAG: aminotransferase class III-fold pyridoxal phosphate-dependent enzyme, partial [Bacteroidota bacterium]
HGIEVEYFHKDRLEEVLYSIRQGDVSSVIIEAIQGVGGLDMISTAHLEAIDQACKETETILIMDEVQSGYGRSGRFFAWQYADIDPDIITMAKGMGNGFPIGGVLIKSAKIPAQKGRLGTTYGGNHLACAAGLAVLEVIEKENLIDNAAKRGAEIKKILENLPGVTKMKGKGLMAGVELEFPAKTLRSDLVFQQHLFTGSSSDPHVLRLLPPLNIGPQEVSAFEQKISTQLTQTLATA